MSIAGEITRLQGAKSSLKTSIEGKGVTVPSETKIDGYAALVDQISQGSAEAPENDVNFYDYDGFRVASYTIAEAKALTALPTPPTHEGLTFQEWNWTLNDIQTYDRQYADIGANYITTDEKTRIKIKTDKSQYIALQISGRAMSLTVDWGDENQDTYVYGTNASNYTFTHSYTNSGEYNLKISCINDSGTDYNYYIATNSSINLDAIKEFNCGNNISLDVNYGLQNLCCIVSITKDTVCNFSAAYAVIPQLNIPNNNPTFSQNYPFNYFNGRISFPRKINSMKAGAMAYITPEKLVFPEIGSASSAIESTIFQTMRYTKVISLPDRQFGTLATGLFFNNCSSLLELDIVQGWVPSQNMSFTSSTQWVADTIVKFFNKLGTTTNAITLTFGTTNLNKLTEEEKAIATNKGYTLA